ncbi:hypothetical protein H9P43_005725 [Blastocladiella emersonii ATCC 22665]|nr:hypothetical protein H9P43_005725 [Blastocladiella emersonii ATCC 22665]
MKNYHMHHTQPGAAALAVAVAAVTVLLLATTTPGVAGAIDMIPFGAAGFVDKGTLYIVGGYDSNVDSKRVRYNERGITALDLTRKWTTDDVSAVVGLPDLPGDKIAFAVPVAASTAHELVLVGGYPGTGVPFGTSEVNPNTTLVFNTEKREWARRPMAAGSSPISSSHSYASAAVSVPATAAGSGGWVFGGHDFDRGYKTDWVRLSVNGGTVQSTNTSSSGTGPSRREIATLTTISDTITLLTGGGNGQGPLSDAWEYNSGAKTWRALKSMAMARHNHAAVVWKSDYLIVIGGLSPNTASYVFLEYLHLPTGTWSRGAIENPAASPVTNLTAAVAHCVGDQIVLAGGAYVAPDGKGWIAGTPPPPVSLLAVAKDTVAGGNAIKFRWIKEFDPAASASLAGAARSGESGGGAGGALGTEVPASGSGGSAMPMILGAVGGGVVVVGLVAVFVVRRNHSPAASATAPVDLESTMHAGGNGSSIALTKPVAGADTLQSTATSLPGYATNDPTAVKSGTAPRESFMYLPQAAAEEDVDPVFLPPAAGTGGTPGDRDTTLYLPGDLLPPQQPAGAGATSRRDQHFAYAAERGAETGSGSVSRRE